MTRMQATEFVSALAAFVAGIVPVMSRTKPVRLFANYADDTQSNDLFSTLRHYDGQPAGRHPRRHLAIQCETLARASSNQTAAVRAQAGGDEIYGRLRNDSGPLLNQNLAGFVLLAIDNLTPTKLIGGEQDGRQRAVFNFDAYYLPRSG